MKRPSANSTVGFAIVSALAFVVLSGLSPHTVEARSGAVGDDYYEYATRGPAFGAGFYLGRGRADLPGAESFSRNWFSVHLGLPVAPLSPESIFSLTYTFQVATDVEDGTGLRPWLFSGEFEYFFPFDPEAYAEFSLFASAGIGWQYFDFDFDGVRNFIFSSIHFGGRFYPVSGLFFQLGFSFQRAFGISEDAFDFDYWNISFKFGIRLP